MYQNTSQNIVLLIAAAAAKKKGYALQKIHYLDYKNHKLHWYTKYKNYLKLNWQPIVSLIVCLLLLLLCSISILI